MKIAILLFLMLALASSTIFGLGCLFGGCNHQPITPTPTPTPTPACHKNGDCPENNQCQGGQCVYVDPCSLINCSGFICKNGKCVSPCENVVCQPGQFCQNGICQPIGCAYCPKNACVNGHCLFKPYGGQSKYGKHGKDGKY